MLLSCRALCFSYLGKDSFGFYHQHYLPRNQAYISEGDRMNNVTSVVWLLLHANFEGILNFPRWIVSPKIYQFRKQMDSQKANPLALCRRIYPHQLQGNADLGMLWNATYIQRPTSALGTYQTADRKQALTQNEPNLHPTFLFWEIQSNKATIHMA